MINRFFKSLLPIYFLFSSPSYSHPVNQIQNNPNSKYSVQEVFNQSEPSHPSLSYDTLEDKFYFDDHHFLTSISYVNDNLQNKQTDIFALRPHPGKDKDGWGFTLYLQPFINNLNYKSELSHTNHPIIYNVNENNVEVNASGKVSRGLFDTYGDWNTQILFSYNKYNKIISATGVYNISLAGNLSITQRDLNLLKIASNFLSNVPLLIGGIGETGDMKKIVDFSSDNFFMQWNPLTHPSHFPYDLTTMLNIAMYGDYNQVDTSDNYGYRINAAYKPSLDFTITSQDDSQKMIFGGVFNTDQSSDFTKDNIGITPLITSSPKNDFGFTISFNSSSPEPSTDSKIILDYASKFHTTETTQELIDTINVVK